MALTHNSSFKLQSRGHLGFVIALAFGLTLLTGGPAAALEDLSPTSVSAAQGDACPELTAIKYPWLSCRANAFGGVTLALPGQPAPLECRLRLPSGECAASPREWRFEMPIIGPAPKT
jgi:hypothetical protein